MLAIHNYQNIYYFANNVANAYAKLSKCQQFTTHEGGAKFVAKLQTLMQSYQNVSNSQLKSEYLKSNSSCKRLCKVIKMLAIHNWYNSNSNSNRAANAFAKLSKCQQFTTG